MVQECPYVERFGWFGVLFMPKSSQLKNAKPPAHLNRCRFATSIHVGCCAEFGARPTGDE
jgi:hypothetical protein